MKRISIVISIGVMLIFGMPWGCTAPKSTIRVLSQQVYTNIEITGWRPFMKSKDEFFSTGFKAQSVNGSFVTGAVTSGFFKGNTIRLD